MSPLRRTLGLTSLVFYGVGTIIGAGIYSVIGAAAGRAGPGLWLSFVLAGAVAGLSALSYAELVTAIPRIGAEYVFLRRAFPGRRWLSFTTGFVVALAGSATAATVALAFAGYMALFLPGPAWIVALVLLVACAGLNITGIRQSTWVNIVFTTVEVLGLLIVIGAGVTTEGFGSALATHPHAGILTATSLIFFVYTGFEGLANLTEEARRPERDLPRAILLSLAVAMVLYTLVGLAVVVLAAPEELAGSDSPLAFAIANVSPRLGTALAWIALCATANTALITYITVSRLVFGMARDGELPKALSKTASRRKTPWVAALVVFAASVTLLPLGTVAVVASVSSLATLLAFVCVNVALIVIRLREPGLERPFRIPLAFKGVPVPAVLGILAAAALATQFEALVYFVTAGTIGLGLGLHALLARHPKLLDRKK